MKSKLINLIIVCFLLFVFSVQAQTLDSFSVLGAQELDVFQCSPAYFTFSVQNLGNTASTYTIYLDGQSADWLNINPSVFTLQSGDYQLVQQAFNIPCDAPQSELFTIIQSSTGEEQVLLQLINVYKPENVHANTIISAEEIQSCQIATYNVELFNLVNFEETYSLSLDKFNENALITPNELSLQPGESKEVIIDVEHKNCSESGDFPFTLLINTKNTQVTGEIDLFLKILPDHIVSVNIENKVFNNEFVEQTIPVLLKNVGSKSSTYDVKLDGPEWASVDKKSLKVEGDQTGELNIHLNPDKANVEDALHNFKLIITVKETGLEFVKEFAVRTHIQTVLEKNALYIAIGSSIGLMLLIFLIVSVTSYLKSPERKQKQELKKQERKRKERSKAKLKSELKAKKEELELKNAWKKEYYKTKYTILAFFTHALLLVFLLGAGWAVYTFRELIQKHWQYSLGAGTGIIVILAGLLLSYFLKSDKSKIARLNLELKKEIKKEEARKKKEQEQLDAWKQAEKERLKSEVEEEYKSVNKIIPKDKIAILERERKSYSWIWSLTLVILTLVFIFGFNYYRDLINNYFYEVYTAGIMLLLLVAFNLAQSLRNSSSNYRLVLVKKKYEFNAGLGVLQNVNFSLISPVEKLKLKATTNSRSDIKPSPWVYDYFELSSNTEETNFESLQYNFKVKKTWIFGNNLKDIQLVNFQNGKWKKVLTEQVGEDNKYIYYQATGDKLGLFAITAKQIAQKKRNYWPLLLGLGGILLIGMITLGYFALTQEQTVQNGISDITISKNGFKTIDLTQYFTDPDGDSLKFGATADHSLTIDIIDGKAKIVPNFNWVGQTSLTFYADDEKGGIVESNKILVKVTEPLIPVEYHDLAKQSVAALVVIIIFLVLIIYRKELLDFLDKD
ncbi:hypothetical protein COV11_00940 [Candidatus Woesearchaeota archaeon CG10_big_fil_rev_8_21_14_0_10_30_7]|nr:MAG: hypothetical protein COV11_00940 [Candidatus Woesearchaeota archaeon CG10_big_fil_rev_8_21_14_0_10_30_7]